MEPEHSGETDIQRLTESTMRISSMEDFQWSVNEPMMKPMQNMLDRGGSNFELSNEGFTIHESISLPPPPPQKQAETKPFADARPPIPPLPPSKSQLQQQATVPEREVIGISQEQIEILIRNEVQAVLEKMAQRLLPEVAEKMIKQEIHRLLSE
jgi:hypothetical protein